MASFGFWRASGVVYSSCLPNYPPRLADRPLWSSCRSCLVEWCWNTTKDRFWETSILPRVHHRFITSYWCVPRWAGAERRVYACQSPKKFVLAGASALSSFRLRFTARHPNLKSGNFGACCSASRTKEGCSCNEWRTPRYATFRRASEGLGMFPLPQA